MAVSWVAEQTPGAPPDQRANARPLDQKATPKRTISDVSLNYEKSCSLLNTGADEEYAIL